MKKVVIKNDILTHGFFPRARLKNIPITIEIRNVDTLTEEVTFYLKEDDDTLKAAFEFGRLVGMIQTNISNNA